MFSPTQEFKYYFEVLSKGMNGPLNYYRTAKQRHEEELGALYSRVYLHYLLNEIP